MDTSFFTPKQLRRKVRVRPLPPMLEEYDPYGNTPDLRLTAQPPESLYTPVDEENLDEQYRC